MWFPKHLLCGSQQTFNQTSKIVCNRLRSSIKQTCQMTCVKISLVRLSNKVVSLDLATLNERVENHRSMDSIIVSAWLLRKKTTC